MLENPALRGQSCITQSLYAGLQLILPGEVAPAHRHTPVGAAPRARRRGRLHRGRRRAHDHAPRRLHHHAVLDLARPRQRRPRARSSGSTAWTSRSCASSTPASPRRATTHVAADRAARRRRARALRQQHAAGRLRAAAARADRACSSIRSRAPAKRCRHRARHAPTRTSASSCATSTRRPARSPMPTIGTFAQRLPAGFATRPLPQHRQHGVRLPRRRGARRSQVRRSDEQRSTSQPRDVFVVPSWHALALARATATRCCSASPTGRCSRCSASGAKNAWRDSAQRRGRSARMRAEQLDRGERNGRFAGPSLHAVQLPRRLRRCGEGPSAGFQEVSGISTDVAVTEYRNGNSRENSAIKITGLNKATDVTLKRGVIGSLNLYAVVQRHPQRQPERAAHGHDPAAERGSHAIGA